MNEKDFQYTLAVAKCQSFSRAAELLYISQPALSRYISNLEAQLGVTLFDRSSSPIQLTAAGKRFCTYANDILELENGFLRELKENSMLTSKPLRVGVPLVSGEYILSRVLPLVMKKHPSIQIDPVQDTSENIRQRLVAHQIDAAFLCLPVSDPSILVEPLCVEDVFLVGSRDHPALAGYDTGTADLDHPLEVDLSALRGVTLIHCKPIAVLSYRTEEALHLARFRPEVELKASSLPLAVELTAQGVGFTGILRCQLKYGHPGITRLLCPIRLKGCTLPYSLAYSRLLQRTPHVLDLFVKEVLEEYQVNPYI